MTGTEAALVQLLGEAIVLQAELMMTAWEGEQPTDEFVLECTAWVERVAAMVAGLTNREP